MSLSSCPECWDDPCTCGHEYKDWSDQRMSKFIFDIIEKRSAESKVAIVDAVVAKLNASSVGQALVVDAGVDD